MERLFAYDSPIGELGLRFCDGMLTELSFLPGDRVDPAHNDTPDDDARRAMRQLDEYFAGTRRAFDIPLRLDGTPFQLRVWEALLQIPYGETRSYKEIAVSVGSPRGARAVGMANHANPLPILVPCHRVIPADGTLGGYGGGVSVKCALLALEKAHC